MNPAGIIDSPGPVRAGDELLAGRIERHLAERLPGFRGPIEILQFPGGYSNLTYLLRAPDRELVLRRPPRGAAIKTAHDMGREFRILLAVSRVYDRVPRPLLYTEDPSVLGAPFYVMERVTGVILRRSPPRGVELSPEIMRRLSEATVDNLAAIHGLDHRAIGLGEEGKPRGYVTRQVQGWAERYARARTEDIEAMEKVALWLEARRPPEAGESLIHNDYKYDNLVLDPEDPSRILAVLDWEMATVGDPLMDLGCSLGYWVEAGDPEELRSLGLGLTHLPGNLSRQEVWDRYLKARGLAPRPMSFYHVFGLFKIAVILQQIYRRHVEGGSTDPRFATLIEGVRALARAAEHAIDSG